MHDAVKALREIQETVNEVFRLAEDTVYNAIADCEKRVHQMQAQIRLESTELIMRAQGERDEARRLVANLTQQLLDAKKPALSVEQAIPTFGSTICECGKPFVRVLRRQRTCLECRAKIGKALVARKAQKALEAEVSRV